MFRRRPKPLAPEDLDLEARWSISEGVHDGRPLLLRRNEALAAVAGHPRYAHQIGVAVPFSAPDEQGYPSGAEMHELDRIEDDLVRGLGDGNESLPAAVITTGGMREFVFYTANPDGARARFEHVAGRHPGHQLQLMIQPDPGWDVYASLGGD